MSHEAEHIQLANRNQAVLTYLLANPFVCNEWAAVVDFYKALHFLEAIFSQNNAIRHLRDHHSRFRSLLSSRAYQPLYLPYRALWSASTVARYLDNADTHATYPSFADFLAPDRLVSDLLNTHLIRFENLAVQLLSNASQLALIRYSPSMPNDPPTLRSKPRRRGVQINDPVEETTDPPGEVKP